MPLVQGGAGPGLHEPESAAAERARKVRPEFTTGPLVRVAGGRNQSEAELIQNLLLEEGVPSMLRRSAGFDVPDFLAAGPRDVMVPEAGRVAAREVLEQAELAPAVDGDADGCAAAGPRAGRLLAMLVAGVVLAALAAWLMLRAAGLG